MSRSQMGTVLGIVALCALAAAWAPRAAATASPAADADDSYNFASTLVTITNAGNLTFTATKPRLITVTCTHFTTSGTTPAAGLGPFAITNPTFNDGAAAPCTDTLGGKDTITTKGAWQVREIDVAGEGESATEPNTGDRFAITIPTAGAVDKNSAGCTITLAPSGPVTISGTFDESGSATITFKNARIPVSVAGSPLCSKATSVTFSGVDKLTPPGLHDVS